MRASVVYWEKWSGTELEAMASVVRAFNASQDGFEVVLVSAGDWSSSADVDGFLAADRAGRTPDLIGLEITEVASLADEGVLSPVPPSVAHRARKILRTDVAGLGMWQGAQYAVPIVADLVTLYVNKAAARGTPLEGGIPTSLVSFDAAMEAMKGQSLSPLVPTYPGWWPEAWPLFFGGGWFDEHDRFTPEREENLRAYEWVAGLKERLPLGRFARETNPLGSLAPEPFFAGEVAVVLDGDWLVRRLVAEADLEWAVAPFPTVDGRGAALLEADLVGIPTRARCPEGAAAFLRFLVSEEPIEALALGQGKVSPLSSWSPEYLACHPNPRLADLRVIWNRSRIFAPPACPAWRAARERIRRAFCDMWRNGVRPHEALARLAMPDSYGPEAVPK